MSVDEITSCVNLVLCAVSTNYFKSTIEKHDDCYFKLWRHLSLHKTFSLFFSASVCCVNMLNRTPWSSIETRVFPGGAWKWKESCADCVMMDILMCDDMSICCFVPLDVSLSLSCVKINYLQRGGRNLSSPSSSRYSVFFVVFFVVFLIFI